MTYPWKGAVAAVALAALLVGPASAQSVSVMVNNREVDFPDQQPVERDGRVYIPLRGVLERIGAESIQWRPSREEVFVASGAREIRLRIGENEASVDGRVVDLDAPPILVGGRTMVPLRFVGENLGATVRWEGATRTVYISVPRDRVAGRRETFPPDQSDEPRDTPPRREMAPLIRPMRPAPGELVSSPRPQITVMLRNRGDREIDHDSIRMRVNGEDVTDELEIGVNSITYRPSRDLDPGTNRVEVTVRDRGGNVSTRDWMFRVR